MAQNVQETLRTALIAQSLREAQVAPEVQDYPKAEPGPRTETALSSYWYRVIDESTGQHTLRRGWWHRPITEE